jgi:hypothetical protein
MRNILSSTIIAAGLLSSSQPAYADNTWGCEVLLCVSNPGGMLQFSPCVPPIRRLITHLALGKGFPTCTGGGTRSVKYQKPKNGRNGTLTITFDDGQRQTYIVPRADQLPPPDPIPEGDFGDFR